MDIKEALQKYQDQPLIKLASDVGQSQPAYYRPITLADHDKVKRHMKAANTESEGVSLVLTIIFKMLDGTGKPIFGIDDKKWLLEKVPQMILAEIVNEMAAVTSIEDAEKN